MLPPVQPQDLVLHNPSQKNTRKASHELHLILPFSPGPCVSAAGTFSEIEWTEASSGKHVLPHNSN